MPATTRTFVAIAVPRSQAEALERLQRQLSGEVAGVRWVDHGHFHLTLAFLDDVDNRDLNSVCRAVNEAAGAHAPLELQLEGLGAFPKPDRPRVVWAGVNGPGLDALTALQKAIARVTREAGYPPSDNRFHPHVTLGRHKPGRGPSPDLSTLVARFAAWSTPSFHVREVVTFASILTPEGPRYDPLARGPLRGENP